MNRCMEPSLMTISILMEMHGMASPTTRMGNGLDWKETPILMAINVMGNAPELELAVKPHENARMHWHINKTEGNSIWKETR